jgi:NAD(P)-dependent dehydrogenase (short-subunit alcohol dehydrogenase family)
MQSWNNAVITGGGSGIGFELARRLLVDGSSVAIIDRSSNDAAKDQLAALAGERVSFHLADVTDAQALQTVFTTIVADLGAPDLVINCAGIQIAKPFAELSGEEFERVVSVNLYGSRNLAAAALPHMRSGSQLALMASLAGLVPSHSYAAYNASKFGVVGLAGALRLECIDRGIEVSVICPPEVNTQMVVEERKNLPLVAGKLKDTAGTLEVGPACQSMLRQLGRRRVLIIPGWRASVVAWIARMFPGIMRRVSERIVLSTP